MVAKVAELIDVQELFGQQVLNVFHYVDVDGVADIATLVDDYVNDVLPLTQQLQSTALSHTAIRYRQVYPTATLVQERALFPTIDGVETGDPLASCDAMSFKFSLGNPTVVLAGGFTGHIKRGGCRLAGATEGNVVGNGIVSGYATAAQTWATELKDPGTDSWLLVVASYLNGARARQHTVQSYSQVTSISAPAPSTQNTRKVLRGRAF